MEYLSCGGGGVSWGDFRMRGGVDMGRRGEGPSLAVAQK